MLLISTSSGSKAHLWHLQCKQHKCWVCTTEPQSCLVKVLPQEPGKTAGQWCRFWGCGEGMGKSELGREKGRIGPRQGWHQQRSPLLDPMSCSSPGSLTQGFSRLCWQNRGPGQMFPTHKRLQQLPLHTQGAMIAILALLLLWALGIKIGLLPRSKKLGVHNLANLQRYVFVCFQTGDLRMKLMNQP